MNANHTEPAVETTAEEFFESLNGFDEIAVARAWGAEITTLAETKPTTFVRALVFTHRRREGDADETAKTFAMTLTLKECNAYFEPEDVDETDPDSDSGKGDESPAGSQPS